MPAREWVAALTLTAFVTPTFIGALGWILMAAPNSGWINLLWRKVTGTDWPVLDIYSMGGAIFVGGIYAVPFAFTIVGTALDEMAVELEDAATTLSSGTLRTMFRITLPMAAPAIYASFILSFIQGVTLFGVPLFCSHRWNLSGDHQARRILSGVSTRDLLGRGLLHAAAWSHRHPLLHPQTAAWPQAVRHDLGQGPRRSADRHRPLAMAGASDRAIRAARRGHLALCDSASDFVEQGLGSLA